MHFLITGGTGLIGSALCTSLLAKGHQITVLTRAVRVSGMRDVSLISRLKQISSHEKIDAVVNLAGAQLVGKRWSQRRKREIEKSRIELTENLVDWLCKREQRPEVLISGSAIGFYGDRGNEQITEESSGGNDYGAELCRRWEQAAGKAADCGIRVCCIRTGLVLSKEGGMLRQLLLPFKLNLGSTIGSGDQWMSWIHIDDEVAIIEKLATDRQCTGPYNLTAPFAERNKDFTQKLATALRRRSFLRTPAFIIHLLLGESGELLTGGQKVNPSRLQQLGYSFRYPGLDSALKNLLQ